MTRMNRGGDDTGASLAAALIFITAVAVVVAVVLSLADTSIRTTLALRGQLAVAANADGAAQVAINTLRNGTYDGTVGECFLDGGVPSDTLTLPNFYQPQGAGPADSAAVTCENDPTHGGEMVDINPTNRPSNAILTLGNSALEDGIYVDVSGGRNLQIHGDVFSNSNVDVPQGSFTTDTSLTARGDCVGSIGANPAPVCNIGAAPAPDGDDPNYPEPTEPPVAQTVPVCVLDNQLITLTPGLYNNVVALNDLTRCRNSILHFLPGTYYFNLPSSTPWVIERLYVVAGTPTAPLVAGSPPSFPGSCLSPIPPTPLNGWTPPPPNSGVQFVFGGGTHLLIRFSRVEICGTYSATKPPIAIYGLKSDAGGVPAQSGCTVLEPYPSFGCAVIDAQNTPISSLHIQGTTYVPRSAIRVELDNSTGVLFGVGVIARSLRLIPTFAADLTGPVIGVPDSSPAGRRTVLYLNVYICEGASTCDATGTRRLRAKVGILDPTGVPVPGARQITVYSWSMLR